MKFRLYTGATINSKIEFQSSTFFKWIHEMLVGNMLLAVTSSLLPLRYFCEFLSVFEVVCFLKPHKSGFSACGFDVRGLPDKVFWSQKRRKSKHSILRDGALSVWPSMLRLSPDSERE